VLQEGAGEVNPFEDFEGGRSAAGGRGEARTEVDIHGGMGHNDTWLQEDPDRVASFAAQAFNLGGQ